MVTHAFIPAMLEAEIEKTVFSGQCQENKVSETPFQQKAG
jgi:hypothetical protein